MQMGDADRLRDSLCGAKERAKLYANAALDATNNGVREFFLAMHGEETHNGEVLFSFLHTREEYPTQMASQTEIVRIRERYQEKHQQMGLTGADHPSWRRYTTAHPEHPAKGQIPQHFDPH